MKEEQEDVLKRYFSTLRAEQPVLSLEELQQLVDAREGEANSTKPYYKTTKFWIMTISLITLLTVISLFLTLDSSSHFRQEQTQLPQAKENSSGESPIKDQEPPKTPRTSDKVVQKRQNEVPHQQEEQPLAPPEADPQATAPEFTESVPPVPQKPRAIEAETQPEEQRIEEPEVADINVAGIPLLELAPADLAKLGIEVYNHEIIVASKGFPFISKYSPEGSTHDLWMQKDEALKGTTYLDTASHPEIFPVFISDYLGNLSTYRYDPEVVEKELEEELVEYSKEGDNWREHRDMVSRYYSRKLNSYVGVLVKSGLEPKPVEEMGDEYHPDLIFWYEVDSSFLSLLPSLIAKELSLEHQVNFVITEQDNVPAQSVDETKSCTYYESCKSRAGALRELLAYPNPAQHEATIRLTTGSDRRLSISLYSISGSLVRAYHKDVLHRQGSTEYRLPLGEVSDGLYLITVTTDQGEVMTQRLVKRAE